jgi:ribosomal protein S18 acetylase RimI-like enzyme
MDVKITEFKKSETSGLVNLMEILQDYIADIDPLHRIRRSPEYGRIYTDSLLKKIKLSTGKIYLAKQDQSILGCIAGAIEIQNEAERAGIIPSKAGRVLDLIVRDGYRGQGIGTKLMSAMEDYFRVNGCDIVRIEVFVPNIQAHAFYTLNQYTNRTYDMVKPI